MEIPGRKAEDWTPEMAEEALLGLVALVREQLPERFHAGEGHWRPSGTALIARTARIAESIAALIRTRAGRPTRRS
jgi:hypothetical protein